MKIEKIPPLKCPSCLKTTCERVGKVDIKCYECGFESDLLQKTRKKKKKYTYPVGRGHDPRFDTGDYLE